MADGRNLLVPFILITSLFFLWGFCNGMIDVMDKHFQHELGLSLSQSAWVQFAHYLGYFLMAMPAGWVANKFGYKSGIIVGLLMVAVGGFWFIPATKIATFPAFLLGVCIIASGLTFLETVANPYSTVLGPKQFSAARINLSQSCNGIGWILGPIVGAQFFYSKNAAGESTGAETLWIPYALVGVAVLLLCVVFFFSKLPDIQSEDEFHLDDTAEQELPNVASKRKIASGLLLLNILMLSVAIGMILSAIVAIPSVSAKLGMTDNHALLYSATVLFVIGAAIFVAKKRRITNHSIWSQPHFTGATLVQFLYVAAQCGIFAYFINYMTSQIPPIPESWKSGMFVNWFEIHKNGILGLTDKSAATLQSVGFGFFVAGRFIGAALMKKYPPYRILGIFAIAAAIFSLIVFLKLGWVSAIAVFFIYLCMSIMFPTIFSLGIHGLGSRAKNASSFIVMAIMGGAIMPKFMGHIGDLHGMSVAFIVPLICFILITIYSFAWPKLTGGNTNIVIDPTRGH